MPNVSGSQELTYAPEVARVTPDTTTQEIQFALVIDGVIHKEEIKPRSKQLARTSNDDVIRRILEVFPEAPIMVEVARCESGLDPTADRANLGVDVGLFQINQVHLQQLAKLGLDRADMEDNLFYARMLYDSNGLNDWFMSKHCWEQYL